MPVSDEDYITALERNITQLRANNPLRCLSPDTTASLLGVSRASVERWIAAGLLPASKVGGRVLIRERDVAAILETNLLHPEGDK